MPVLVGKLRTDSCRNVGRELLEPARQLGLLLSTIRLVEDVVVEARSNARGVILVDQIDKHVVELARAQEFRRRLQGVLNRRLVLELLILARRD